MTEYFPPELRLPPPDPPAPSPAPEPPLCDPSTLPVSIETAAIHPGWGKWAQVAERVIREATGPRMALILRPKLSSSQLLSLRSAVGWRGYNLHVRQRHRKYPDATIVWKGKPTRSWDKQRAKRKRKGRRK